MATIPGCIIIFTALLLCYAIFPVYVEQQRKDSWYHSVVLLGGAFLISFILFLQMVQGETPDLSRFVDWPAPLGILKDFFVFFTFAVLYFTNLYNYVGTLDFLTRRYQITTVQKYLKKPNFLGTAIPVRLVAFSWKWALYGILFAGSVLLVFEMITYWTLKEGVESAKWYITLGIVRDFLLIILAAEVLIWYRNSLITIRRSAKEF